MTTHLTCLIRQYNCILHGGGLEGSAFHMHKQYYNTSTVNVLGTWYTIFNKCKLYSQHLIKIYYKRT